MSETHKQLLQAANSAIAKGDFEVHRLESDATHFKNVSAGGKPGNVEASVLVSRRAGGAIHDDDLSILHWMADGIYNDTAQRGVCARGTHGLCNYLRGHWRGCTGSCDVEIRNAHVVFPSRAPAIYCERTTHATQLTNAERPARAGRSVHQVFTSITG